MRTVALLVEDQPALLQLMKRMLADYGITGIVLPDVIPAEVIRQYARTSLQRTTSDSSTVWWEGYDTDKVSAMA